MTAWTRIAHGAALLLLLGAGRGWAAGTDPTLALSTALASTSSAGVTAVWVSGTFNFDDLLQFPYPAGVVVYQGTHFARIDSTGAVSSGTAAYLADGLSASELDALLAAGSPAPPPAALLQLHASRLAVALPSGFSPGTATVVVYAVLENTSFLSNAVNFTVPPAGP